MVGQYRANNTTRSMVKIMQGEIKTICKLLGHKIYFAPSIRQVDVGTAHSRRSSDDDHHQRGMLPWVNKRYSNLDCTNVFNIVDYCRFKNIWACSAHVSISKHWGGLVSPFIG